MRNINLSWKIMNDPTEPDNQRVVAEAEIRELAWVGMLPQDATNELAVLAQCASVRQELGIEMGPQPIRFDTDELYLLISAVEAVSVGNENSGEFDSILNKLRHRAKSLRNAKNRDKKGRQRLHARHDGNQSRQEDDSLRHGRQVASGYRLGK